MSKTNIYSKLQEKLDPSLIKTREGGNGKELSYIEGWKVEDTANEIFNFDWDKEIKISEKLFERNYKSSKDKEMVEVAYKAIVKITVRFDGKTISKDGTGFGNGQSSVSNPSAAYELAVKEAETDAAKRAFKSLGKQFGIELYDKEYKPLLDYDDDWKNNKDVLMAKKAIIEINDEKTLRDFIDTYFGSYREKVIDFATARLKEIKGK